MSQQDFIKKLFDKRSDYKDPEQAEMAANLLDAISTDIYSENIRFVFELIQNADDSAFESGNEISFDFFENSLVVSHNGQPFTEEDINSLTSAGSSTKTADPTKTGYKGIGFKSVFGKSECVTIFSREFQFRFDKKYHNSKLPWQVIPIWTEASELHITKLSEYFNAHNVNTLIAIAEPESLMPELEELLSNGQILLFLRKITKINVLNNGTICYSIEKKTAAIKAEFTETSLLKSDEVISNWITKTFEHISVPTAVKEALAQDDKTPKKLKEADFSELTFAAKIADGAVISLTGDESLIFTYLPTKVRNFNFPFLLNGSFLTNASREDIHADRYWNKWLMSLAGEKLIDWLRDLGSTKYHLYILRLLPELTANFSGALKSSFINSIEAKAKLIEFIPSTSLRLATPGELIIDKTGLSQLDFLSPDIVIEFLNRTENKKFKPDSFIHQELKNKERLRNLGSHIFDIEHLENFFLSAEFQANHVANQNFALIEYFYQIAQKDETNEWNKRLTTIPFMFTSDDQLKNPASVCFPSIAYATSFGASVTVIHDTVYDQLTKNSKVKDWLELLGVKEPSDVSFLENEIIGNVQDYITPSNHLQVIRYLFDQFLKRYLTDEHFEELRLIKVFTVSGDFVAAEQCYLSDFYEPVLKLEKVNDRLSFVSSCYRVENQYISEWKTFFLKLGIVENVELQTISLARNETNTKYPDFSEFFDNNSTQPYTANSGSEWTNSIRNYKIATYSLLEFATEYQFSKLFWNSVLKSTFTRQLPDRGYADWHNSPNLKENFFEWCINNAAIFPTSLGTCTLATEIFINDKDIVDVCDKFLPIFDYGTVLSEEWKKMLPFKRNLELNDYFDLLDLFASDYDDGRPITKTDQKRLGLIYNKLLDILPNLSLQKKEEIKDWAMFGKLPAANLRFENLKDLKFVNVVGFNNTSEKLKVLLLPQNVRVGTLEFTELLGLLNIRTINEFIPRFGDTPPKIALDFKNKLFSILPHLAAMIEKKKFLEFADEYIRLRNIVEISEFYSTTEINLIFLHEGESLIGSSLHAFRGNDGFYFKGRWNGPLTMFFLIQELTAYLGAEGLNDELRLLLELDEGELNDYFLDMGIDTDRPEFNIRKTFQELSIPLSYVIIDKENVEQILEDAAHDFESFVENKEFIPNYTPLNVNTKSIKATKKVYEGTTIVVADESFPEIKSDIARTKIGRWSEHLAYEYLKNETDFKNIIWVNENEESYLPYDIVAKDNDTEVYIDVKGTPSASKDQVFLSGPEWIFMMEKGENYSLYRVYSVGELDARIEIIGNVRDLVIKGKIIPNKLTLQI
jgi:hypothetical protein